MRDKGFTLIELLVVVAVIAIIAGILFPVLTRAKLQAKVARVHVELKQVGAAIQMYSDDWDGSPPLASESCDSVNVDDYLELPPPLYDYIGTRRYYDLFNPGRTYKYIAPGPGYVNGMLSRIKIYVPTDYPRSEEECTARRKPEDSPIKWAVWSVGPSGGGDLFQFHDYPDHRYPVSKQVWYPYYEDGVIVRLSDGRKSP